MPEVGEEIVGAYLKECRNCDLVEYNCELGKGQGECDVVGLDLPNHLAYFCEVTTHTRGLMYINPRTKQRDNVGRLTRKLARDTEFARRRFPKFKHVFMFWSPIVRGSRSGARENAWGDVERVRRYCSQRLGVRLQVIANEEYLAKLNELRDAAGSRGSHSPFSILRFLQIEEKLKRCVKRGDTERRRALAGLSPNADVAALKRALEVLSRLYSLKQLDCTARARKVSPAKWRQARGVRSLGCYTRGWRKSIIPR